MAELREFRLPDVGEGLTEADIVSWHVKPGDRVEVNQVIVEIETAKAVVELPSPWDGTVARLLVAEGQTADVGTPIIAVDVSAAGPAAGGTADSAERAVVPAPVAAADTVPARSPERQPVLVGYGVREAATSRRARKAAPGPAAPAVRAPAARVLAKPPVRRLAKDLGIELAALSGTGPDGTITRDDVQRAAGEATAAPVAGGPANGAQAAGRPRAAGEERIPVRGVRRTMASAMVASAFSAPHVTEFLQVDMTETMQAVRRIRGLPDYEGVRVSPLLFVARALLVAARRHPLVNSAWDEAAQEIVIKHYVNLGVAVAADRGLLVPNVKHAHQQSLPELARSLQALADTARAGRATPADLTGGTITITNIGVFGVDGGTPILTPGEAAILAFGQVRDMPWVVDGQLAVRQVSTLSLSFDHRIIDGELGSAVLREVGAMLADPVRMVAWS
jgi:pyruvate dehydrogenase E2 component (dihydrolipoamide acetyltransferase)